jgi:SAM-dependent methyltransferase
MTVLNQPYQWTDPYIVDCWNEAPDPSDGSYAYWNDTTIEKRKAWWVETENDVHHVDRWLESTSLLLELRGCLAKVQTEARGQHWIGADLACGNAWATPHLLTTLEAAHVYCVEYSRHRLLQLAPIVLKHHRVGSSQVTLCLGSFYHLKLEPHSLDFVLLSQAFHHANLPIILMAELLRVLKPNGVVFVVGEHRVPKRPWIHARHAARYLATRAMPGPLQRALLGRQLAAAPRLFASTAELLASDPATGDHYYTPTHYDAFFSGAGFDWACVDVPGAKTQAFVLSRRKRTLPPRSCLCGIEPASPEGEGFPRRVG